MMVCSLFLFVLAIFILRFPSEAATTATNRMVFANKSNSTNADISNETKNSSILPPRYEEIFLDASGLRFQYEESAEDYTVWETHIQKISHGILQLALQLQYVLSTNEYEEYSSNNLVFSPVNIAAALAMVMLGSAGKTYTEIATALRLLPGVDVNANSIQIHYNFGKLIRKLQADPNEQMSTMISIAGAIFVKRGYPIDGHFSRLSRDIYASEVLNLDFYWHSPEAKEAINSWVAYKTHGKIPSILEYPPSRSTRVIIASALYFNGAWEYPFPPEQSKRKPFYIEGSENSKTDEVLQVIMMVNGAKYPYYHDRRLKFQVVGLPYKDHTATMYLILPDVPGLQALEHLEETMTASYLHELPDLATKRIVIVAVPRMKLESTIHLKPALKSLGINSLFEPTEADLSKITSYHPPVEYQNSNINTSTLNNISITSEREQSEKIEFRVSDKSEYSNPGLYAEDIIHKVTIEVTDTGTEASAASIVKISRDGSHKVVRFERPFLFYIQHKITGVILFWGKVIRPTT